MCSLCVVLIVLPDIARYFGDSPSEDEAEIFTSTVDVPQRPTLIRCDLLDGAY